MRFLVDGFPLIVTVSAPIWDAAEVRALVDGFEPYFQGNQRYAVLSVSSPNAPAPGHAERKLIGAWTGHPRVRDAIKRLCVGAATVVPSALERAALQIIWALGKPPCPSEAVPTIERGLDYCLARIRDEGLPMPKPPDLVRYETLRTLSKLFER
ncbi:MAG TPA: hypothetical protein VGK73_13710 [Polyangiaceae bacterium]